MLSFFLGGGGHPEPFTNIMVKNEKIIMKNNSGYQKFPLKNCYYFTSLNNAK